MESRTSGITPGTTGRDRNHAQHTIMVPHNGHAAPLAFVPHRHNEPSAPRVFVPHRHNGHRTPGPAERAFRMRNCLQQKRKKDSDHAPRTPNGLAFSCRKRTAQDHIKKATISRAKRSTATPCSAATDFMASVPHIHRLPFSSASDKIFVKIEVRNLEQSSAYIAAT